MEAKEATLNSDRFIFKNNNYMLKITAYQKDGSLFRSHYNDADSIPTSEYFPGEWFLHGELQCFVGFDKGIATNCEELDIVAGMPNFAEIKNSKVVSIFNRKTMYRMKFSGVIPVEVEGIDRPCTGYFWLEDETEIKWEGYTYPYWRQRGLVVFADNREDNCYAHFCYEHKRMIYTEFDKNRARETGPINVVRY